MKGRRRLGLFLPVVIAAALAAGSCSKKSSSPPTAPAPPAGPGPGTVQMIGTSFTPSNITVSKGDTVLWVNNSNVTHTTTSGACPPCNPDGLWNSGNMGPGASFRVVFSAGTNSPGVVHVDSSGVFPYYCIPHAFIPMNGQITVNP